MDGFFDQVAPAGRVSHGCATIELPVLYFRDDFFALFFAADEAKVRAALPSDSLHPVSLPGAGAVVAVGAFNYLETSIGPYGEVGVVVPVVHGRRPLPLLPLLREGNYPGFGLAVLHLPVTTLLSRDGGRGQWGYAKFTADMRFSITPEFMEVRLEEGGRHVLTLRVARKGVVMRDRRPFVTYTVKDGELIRTSIPQKAAFRQSLSPAGSFLELGDHEVAHSIRGLGLSKRPFLSRYAVERAAVLPPGQVVEEGVRPMEGYLGQDREGRLVVDYTGRGCGAPRTAPSPGSWAGR